VTDPNELADRYVQLWNEPDRDRRRAAIADLWTEDGVHTVEPPEEMRKIAAQPGLGMTARLEAQGHEALEVRVSRAYEQWIAPGEFTFRRRDNVARLADVVKFNWEMVSTRDGEIAGVGLDFLVLAPDGRIRIDYQFIES
jgi:hypothetical protein